MDYTFEEFALRTTRTTSSLRFGFDSSIRRQLNHVFLVFTCAAPGNMPGKKGNCGKGGAPMAPGVGMNGLGKGGIADDEDEEGPLLSFSEGPFTVG